MQGLKVLCVRIIGVICSNLRLISAHRICMQIKWAVKAPLRGRCRHRAPWPFIAGHVASPHPSGMLPGHVALLHRSVLPPAGVQDPQQSGKLDFMRDLQRVSQAVQILFEICRVKLSLSSAFVSFPLRTHSASIATKPFQGFIRSQRTS